MSTCSHLYPSAPVANYRQMDTKVLRVTHKTDIYHLPFPPIKANSVEKSQFMHYLRRELVDSQLQYDHCYLSKQTFVKLINFVNSEQKELKKEEQRKKSAVITHVHSSARVNNLAPLTPDLCHSASPSSSNPSSAIDKSDIPRLIQPRVCFGAVTVWITAIVKDDEPQPGPSERLGEQQDRWWTPSECPNPRVFDFKLGRYVPWVGPLPEAVLGEGWDKTRKQHVLRLRWTE